MRLQSKKRTNSLSSKVFVLVIVALLVFSLSISVGLGLFTLWNHPADPTKSSSSLIAESVRRADSYRQLLSLATNDSLRQDILTKEAAQMDVPFYPPFAPISNGEALAAGVLDGTNPSIAGIVHVLQMFLRKLRKSNKDNQQVSNDSSGLDIVRTAYFDLVRKYLLPLDEPYRGRTIFPVRIDEESIFISLAAFREHLLYETLSGAFGKAKYPDKLYVGVVMQNCFGLDDETGEPYGCKTGAQVIGKDKNGKDMTKVSDAPPDINGVEKFCSDPEFNKYCTSGQLRVLSVHESESLGPAAARYYASKLWGGETYFLQADSHLEFTALWDEHYINEIKATKNYPKSVLSMYPPGFGHLAGETAGTRLCTCEFSPHGVEDHIIRINNGMSYAEDKVYPRPTQIAFIAAGFFFARAEFLKDVPFDPFLPWCFMGEEIALSMRAWTSGWNIYAPRKNWIAHQYRPGRMGLPKFWGSVGRTFKRNLGFSNRLQAQVVNRIKHLVGYPEITKASLDEQGLGHILIELDHYGMGTVRSRAEYAELANIDFDKKICHKMVWCNRGKLD